MTEPSSRLSAAVPVLRWLAVPAGMLLAACALTTLAARHVSRAHGGVLALHLLAGVLALLLPLAAVAWVLHRGEGAEWRTRAGAFCAATAAGIAAVLLGLLAWLALAAGLAAFG